MSSTNNNHMQPKCAKCAKTFGETGAQLQFCGSCKTTSYCSRECQRGDWGLHKKSCGIEVDAEGYAIQKMPARLPPDNDHFQITWPTTGGMLDSFPEATVFKILIEAYRLLDEERRMSSGQLIGIVKSDPKVQYITGFSFAGLQAFLQLSLDPTPNVFRVEIPHPRMPPWWNEEKKSACEAVARRLYHWSDLKTTPPVPAEVDDFRRYGGVTIRPSLRFLAMWVTGEMSPACALVPKKNANGVVILSVVPKADLDPTQERNDMLRGFFGLWLGGS